MILLALGILIIYFLFKFFRSDFLVFRIWCAVWGGSAIAAIPFESRNVFDFSDATVYLLVLTLAIGLGGCLSGLQLSRRLIVSAVAIDSEQSSHGLSLCAHVWWLAISTLIGFLSIHMLLIDLGHDYSIFTDLNSLVAVSASSSIARYQDGFDPSPSTRFLTSFVYLAPFFAGWLARRISGWERVLMSLLSFLPALLWTILMTAKMAVLFWLSSYVSAFLCCRGITLNARASAQKTKSNMLMIIYGVIFVLLILLFLFWVQLSRYGNDWDESSHVVTVLSISAVGHHFAFREWFELKGNWFPEMFGARSFAGIFDVLGIAVRESGIYIDDNVKVGESQTNVFTAVRSITEDVGVILSICLFCFLGICTAFLEKRSMKNTDGNALLAVLTSWVIWSPITSAWAYNSLIFASVIFILIARGNCNR